MVTTAATMVGHCRFRSRSASQGSVGAGGVVRVPVTLRRVMTQAQPVDTLARCMNQQINQEQPGSIAGILFMKLSSRDLV